MGIKKVLKKVAKIGLPVGAAILAAKGLGNRSKKNWITKNNEKVRGNWIGKIAEGVGPVYKHVTGDGRGMEEVAAKNRALNAVFKKGGLVKSGKPKLAKKGWK